MKRVILILAMAAGFSAAAAQEIGGGVPSVSQETAAAAGEFAGSQPEGGAAEGLPADDNLLLTMRRGDRPDEIVLQLPGCEVTLGGRNDSLAMKRRKRRVSFELLNNIEVGFTRLQGVDYAGYDAEAGRFLDLQHGKSVHLGFSMAGLSVPINRKGTISFSTGLDYSMNNYRLSDNSIVLLRKEGRLVPEPLDEAASKSKFVTSAFGIPVRFSFEPVDNLCISAMAYCDFALDIESIYKSPRVAHELSGLNPVQFGVGGSIVFHEVGFFVRYSLSPLFRSGNGPECHPLSFGLTIHY